MDAVDIAEAKDKLSDLVELVERGEEVVISRRGRAIVKLVRVG